MIFLDSASTNVPTCSTVCPCIPLPLVLCWRIFPTICFGFSLEEVYSGTFIEARILWRIFFFFLGKWKDIFNNLKLKYTSYTSLSSLLHSFTMLLSYTRHWGHRLTSHNEHVPSKFVVFLVRIKSLHATIKALWSFTFYGNKSRYIIMQYVRLLLIRGDYALNI